MAETSVRNHFRDKLEEYYGDKVHFVRFEDKYGVGIPDANFSIVWPFGLKDPTSLEVWVEFKDIPELPKRDSTPIRIPFRRGQAKWLEKRRERGGTAIVCAKVEGVWMMFQDGFKELEDGVTMERFLELCYWRCGKLKFPNCLEDLE